MSLIAETSRLVITRISRNDTSLLYGLTSDADVMTYVGEVSTYEETSELVQEILQHYERHGYCFWKLMHKPNNEFIGIAGVLHQELDGRVEAEISYRIMRKHWSQGYATEAASACIAYARSTLGKTRLVSIIHPCNAASLRVAQKLGARKERSVQFIGTPHDLYVHRTDADAAASRYA